MLNFLQLIDLFSPPSCSDRPCGTRKARGRSAAARSGGGGAGGVGEGQGRRCSAGGGARGGARRPFAKLRLVGVAALRGRRAARWRHDRRRGRHGAMDRNTLQPQGGGEGAQDGARSGRVSQNPTPDACATWPCLWSCGYSQHHVLALVLPTLSDNFRAGASSRARRGAAGRVGAAPTAAVGHRERSPAGGGRVRAVADAVDRKFFGTEHRVDLSNPSKTRRGGS